MTEWTSPVQPVRCIVDLASPLTVRRERGVLAQGDENANAIVVEVYQEKDKPYDLTGCTVTLTFVRPDKLAVPPIEAVITGNVAVMTLTDTCYRVSGLYAASVKLLKGSMERTIVRVLGDIISTENDGTVDDEQLFPTPDELLEMLLRVEQARTNAEVAAGRADNAAERANRGANRVEQMQVDASGLAGDSNKLGGKPAEAFFARNLLDNSYFRKPVNQRGKTSYTGTGYGIDRWRTNFSGDTVAVVSDGVRNTITSTTNGWHMHQIISDAARLVGKSVTTACNVVTPPSSDIRLCCSFRDNSDAEISNIKVALTSGICVVSGKVPTGTVSIRLGFYAYGASGNDSFTLEWAAIYEGAYTANSLPTYVAKGYAAELAECQRYFYILKAYWKWLFAGICTNTTTAIIPIRLPVAMRVAPTVTMPDSSLVKVRCGAVASQVPTAISWEDASALHDYVQLTATVSGATNGAIAMLYFDNGGVIEFSADL